MTSGASSQAPTKDWQNTIQFVQGRNVLQSDALSCRSKTFSTVTFGSALNGIYRSETTTAAEVHFCKTLLAKIAPVLFEQCSKPLLVDDYWGLYYPIYLDYNNPVGKPVLTNQYDGMIKGF